MKTLIRESYWIMLLCQFLSFVLVEYQILTGWLYFAPSVIALELALLFLMSSRFMWNVFREIDRLFFVASDSIDVCKRLTERNKVLMDIVKKRMRKSTTPP